MTPARPMPSAPPLLDRLFEAQLRRDDPRRQAALAQVMLVFGVLATAGVAVVARSSGWTTQVTLARLICVAALTGYQAAALALLRAGKHPPALPWVSTLVEVSFPGAILWINIAQHGAERGLAAPPLLTWPILILASAFRMRPRVCVFAGLLAATEAMAVQFLAIAGPSPITDGAFYGPGAMAVRGLMLALTGLMAGALARHMTRQLVEALHALRAQDLMGKYLLHEPIGHGGMGQVFRATYSPEGGFEKTVAVKRIRTDASKGRRFEEMFLDEARIGASLAHPNVVQVLDVGKLEGEYVLALEYVDGASLAALLKASPRGLPIPAVLHLAVELSSALEYIHHRLGPDGQPAGLVHRDVNPPNVLVSRLGEVKLGDFGIATAGQSDEFAGKPEYMAPEQASGVRYDSRADLFALGLVLHESLTGKRVFQGRTVPTEIFPPGASRPDVPRELDQLVMDLLAIDPMRRIQGAGDVRARAAGMATRDGRQALAVEVVRAKVRTHEAAAEETVKEPRAM